MKNQLQAIFYGASAEAIAAALGELGYVPKIEGAVILHDPHLRAIASALGIEPSQLAVDLAKADFTKLGSAAVGPAVEAARKAARTETLAYVGEILGICARAGKLEMALGLIRAATGIIMK